MKNIQIRFLNKKTGPTEALEIKLNKKLDTFSFSPPIHLISRWFLTLASFETSIPTLT